MARFPKTEAKVVELAREFIQGFTRHQEVFPSPPAAPADLEAALALFIRERQEADAALAAARQQRAAKNEALRALVACLKKNVRYAENTVTYDDEKLRLIGWGGRRQRAAPEPPGPVRQLEITHQGPGSLSLKWNRPVTGGKVAAYKVQVRHAENGRWSVAASAVKCEVTLNGQQRGVELEYRVLAFNRTGEGHASKSAKAVL
jgi:hypothetical protein